MSSAVSEASVLLNVAERAMLGLDAEGRELTRECEAVDRAVRRVNRLVREWAHRRPGFVTPELMYNEYGRQFKLSRSWPEHDRAEMFAQRWDMPLSYHEFGEFSTNYDFLQKEEQPLKDRIARKLLKLWLAQVMLCFYICVMVVNSRIELQRKMDMIVFAKVTRLSQGRFRHLHDWRTCFALMQFAMLLVPSPIWEAVVIRAFVKAMCTGLVVQPHAADEWENEIEIFFAFVSNRLSSPATYEAYRVLMLEETMDFTWLNSVIQESKQ